MTKAVRGVSSALLVISLAVSRAAAAGALIGTAVGRGVVAFNRKLRSGDSPVRVAFTPISGQGYHGAALVVNY
jgi:hypothetical protein